MAPFPDTGCFIGSDFERGGTDFEVLDKYAMSPLARISVASEANIETALSLAKAYQPASGYDRCQVLLRTRDALERRRDEACDLMVAEAGFPLRDADSEIDRALQTLTLSAEEAKRIAGEVIPFHGAPGGKDRVGFTLRVPLGTVVAITPFNAPLNTVCHKVAPAFAAGNAVILKPSDKTPLIANLLAECFAEADIPSGALSVLHGDASIAQALLADQRPNFYAFTGSTAVGIAIQKAAGLRRTQMELGSIAGTIVLSDADLAQAALKCAGASFRKAGQVCTSIQILLIERPVFHEFRDLYLDHVKALRFGDPSKSETDVGPMISLDAAKRVEALVADRKTLTGGPREGAVVPPTVIELNSDRDDPLLQNEIFGPVVCLLPINGISEAIQRINATEYGLATGLFTQDLNAAFQAARQLRVGGVHIGETSSSRVDLMPYGGTKASGFGHEGPKYAILEMTEERLVTFSGFGQ